MDVRLKIYRDRDISKHLVRWRLLESSMKILRLCLFNLENHNRFRRKRGRPVSRREGKTGLFRLALAGSPSGRVASPRSDHKDPSDWRDIRRQEGAIKPSLFRKNAHAGHIWGNKCAVGTEHMPPLQSPKSQYLMGFVHCLSIQLHVKYSAVFLISCSPLHSQGG